ncbi:Hypp1988 [Branchiostoma lanceolatum]|uniref:Hypp1988 protein n=1 Tax=Branchiostoma lanceolatum TaxID=7740 RepID=A0A8K0EL76_BRALA|nr:Hypp1988 [Branchiostoma lanceolatum]
MSARRSALDQPDTLPCVAGKARTARKRHSAVPPPNLTVAGLPAGLSSVVSARHIKADVSLRQCGEFEGPPRQGPSLAPDGEATGGRLTIGPLALLDHFVSGLSWLNQDQANGLGTQREQ